MRISRTDTPEATLVAFEGRLDTASAQATQDHLVGVIREGSNKLVLDFRGLNFISSVGLRVLLLAAKQASSAGGEVRICSMNEMVRSIFEISGFDRILKVYDQPEDALRGF